MALPFLPAQHIQSTFVRIESLVPPNGKMLKLINYVCQPWIELPVFVLHCWTVYHITLPFGHYRSVDGEGGGGGGGVGHGSVYFAFHY